MAEGFSSLLIWSLRVGAQFRPSMFGLFVTDNPHPPDDDSALGVQGHANMGEISVEFNPIAVTSFEPPATAQPAVALHAGKVHERSKKAGVHTIQSVI
jgi:hypothetical protein